MSVIVTFDTYENYAAFAVKTGLAVTDGATSVEIPWGKLKVAKNSVGAESFVHSPSVRAEGSTADPLVEFIMKGDITDAQISDLITVKADLGNGFHHIETTQGLELFDLVEGLDPVSAEHAVFHETSSINGVNPSQTDIDPLSTDGQWARIRIASTYRPLLAGFEYYDNIVTKSVPEVYLADSGVNWNHPEFVGTSHDDFWKASIFSDFDDDIGHGTIVASAIFGSNVGIAKNIKVRSCKVKGPQGSANFLELGNLMDAIIAETITKPNVTRIFNASWTVDENVWLEAKFLQLMDAGVTVICASGNNGIDVNTLTPAGMPEVLTVGATDRYDIPAGFNNIAPTDSGLTTGYGQRLDIFAPGDDVAVATKAGGYMISSGTSISAGYVSGAAAQLAALFADELPYPLLLTKIIDTSTKDAILFDDDRFSENQNKLVHLIGTKDVQANSLDLYLGAFSVNSDEFTLDLNNIVNISHYTNLLPDESFVWSISFEESNYDTLYGEFMSLNSVSGLLTATKPTVPLDEGETIRMVRFKTYATSDTVSLESPWVLFFQVDQTIDPATMNVDITRALSETNSTSIFLATASLK
jgi:subtilisin family serine protease